MTLPRGPLGRRVGLTVRCTVCSVPAGTQCLTLVYHAQPLKNPHRDRVRRAMRCARCNQPGTDLCRTPSGRIARKAHEGAASVLPEGVTA